MQGGGQTRHTLELRWREWPEDCDRDVPIEIAVARAVDLSDAASDQLDA